MRRTVKELVDLIEKIDKHIGEQAAREIPADHKLEEGRRRRAIRVMRHQRGMLARQLEARLRRL
jgi:hypothetical protein